MGLLTDLKQWQDGKKRKKEEIRQAQVDERERERAESLRQVHRNIRRHPLRSAPPHYLTIPPGAPRPHGIGNILSASEPQTHYFTDDNASERKNELLEQIERLERMTRRASGTTMTF